jgi:hypothetical protein
MFDLQEEERAAIRAAVKPVAEIMEEIGWLTRLCDVSEVQVLTLIEVAVGEYQDAMQAMAKPEGPEVPF